MDNEDQPLKATQRPGRDQLQNVAKQTKTARQTLEDRIGQLQNALNELDSDIDALGHVLEPVSLPVEGDSGMDKEADETESVLSAHVRYSTNHVHRLRDLIANIRDRLDL